jgi:hypothetical protein
MARKLADSTIRQTIHEARLAPQQKQVMLWDAKITGLGLRFLPGGSKTFWFMYRPRGLGHSISSRMVRIGTYPEVSLPDARNAARNLAGKVAEYKDPAAEGRKNAAAPAPRCGRSLPRMANTSAASSGGAWSRPRWS